MNKPRTQPNSNKKWTIRNAHAFLIEKLGIDNHAQQMILKNTLERVAEHYVFEGHNMSKSIEPAEQREYTKTYYIDGEKYEKKYTIKIEKPS